MQSKMENSTPALTTSHHPKLREGQKTFTYSRHDFFTSCPEGVHQKERKEKNSEPVTNSNYSHVDPCLVEDGIDFQGDDRAHLFYKHRLKRNISLTESDVVKEEVKYFPSYLFGKDQMTKQMLQPDSRTNDFRSRDFLGLFHEVSLPTKQEGKQKKELSKLLSRQSYQNPSIISTSPSRADRGQTDFSHSNYREIHSEGFIKSSEETVIVQQQVHEDPKISIATSQNRRSSPTETTAEFVDTSMLQDSSVLKYRVDDESSDNLTLTKSDVKVTLLNASLWKAFNAVGTEMIINRGGRRMFPYLSLSVSGLKPDALYSVTLEILPASTRRFKYINSKWIPVGLADTEPIQAPCIHPDSPSTGLHFGKIKIIFSKVKLTNNKESSDGNILLHSMHKYRIVTSFKQLDNKRNQPRLSFTFPETDFIAVTAYQNEGVTQMKIHNNPFAKAFRDSSFTAVRRGIASRRKRHQMLAVCSRDKQSCSHDSNPLKRLAMSPDSGSSPIPTIVSPVPTPTSSSTSLLAGSGFWSLFQQDPGPSIPDKAIHAVGVPYLMPWMGVYPSLFPPTLYPSLYPPVTSSASLEPGRDFSKENDS